MTTQPTIVLLESIRAEQQRQLDRLTIAMRETEGLPRVQVVEVRRCLIATIHRTDQILRQRTVRDGRT